MSSNNWNEYLIEDISEVVFSGGTPSTQKEEYWGGEYNWLSSGETRNTFITNTEKTITEAGVKNSSTKLAKKNDIVIASAGQGNTRGQVSLCKIDTFINQSIIAIRTNNKLVNPVYVFYNLKSRYKELRQISDGHSIRGSLTTKIINKMKINLPPIKDQNNIANILSSFDEKIEINNQISKKLEEMAQAIFKQWFVDFEFPNENGEPYKTSGGEMVESELGMIPKGWKVQTLDGIGELKNGVNYSRDENGDTEYRIVNVRNLVNTDFISANDLDKIKMDSLKAEQYQLEIGDLLLVRSASPGELGIVLKAENALIYSGFIIRFRLNNKRLLYHIYYSLKGLKKYLNQYSNGTTLKNINQQILKNINVTVPDQEILNKFNSIINPIINQITNLNNEIEKCKIIRDTLLPKLMSGEIRVPVEE